MHLDLSANAIAALPDNLAAALPAKSLRVLNLYGNPCAGGDGAAEGYRAAVTAALWLGSSVKSSFDQSSVAPSRRI